MPAVDDDDDDDDDVDDEDDEDEDDDEVGWCGKGWAFGFGGKGLGFRLRGTLGLRFLGTLPRLSAMARCRSLIEKSPAGKVLFGLRLMRPDRERVAIILFRASLSSCPFFLFFLARIYDEVTKQVI